MSALGRLANLLPSRLLYPATAWSYRLQREQRLLFLRELVDPDRPAVDVGAWWGPWTYWLARRCPLVVAVEPNPTMAAQLRALTPGHVRVEAVALSADQGQGTLWVPEGRGRDALASLERPGDVGFAGGTSVRLTRLDDVVTGDVGFLKIDVEGHELAVLRGGRETLRRHRPVVLIELEDHRAPVEASFDLLADLGYEGWCRRSGRWASIDTFTVAADQAPYVDRPTSRRFINNFVFMPVGAGPPAAR